MTTSLKTNYIFNLLNTVSALVFPLVTFPYVARILIPDGIGEVNFFLSIVTYISMFTSLGIPTYAIIEIAKVKDDVRQRSIITAEILTLNLLLTFIGYVIVGILCLTIKEIQEDVPLFLIISLNIILVAIGCEWYYQGTENYKFITIRGVIIRVICVVLLFTLVRDADDLIYYGLYCVLGVAGNNILNFLYLRKNINTSVICFRELDIRRHLVPSLRIFLLNVISSIYLQLDTVMLGFLKDNTAVGYYTGAIKLTKVLMGVTTSLGVVFLPRITSLLNSGKLKDAKELLGKTIEFIVGIALPISAGLLFMAPTLIHLFCGEQYMSSIPTLKILSPIILFISISYIYAQTMLAHDKVNTTIWIGTACSIVNVVANFLLIPRLSQNGAAIGTLLAEFTSLTCYLIVARLFFKANHVFNRHSLQCLAACSVMCLALWIITRQGLDDVLSLLIMPVAGAVTYGLVLLCFGNRMLKEYIHHAKIKIFA